jgi:hypothetical protein
MAPLLVEISRMAIAQATPIDPLRYERSDEEPGHHAR